MKYITQLAATVPPTNNTKQSAPNLTIIFGSARCVMPNTIEVKSENSKIGRAHV